MIDELERARQARRVRAAERDARAAHNDRIVSRMNGVQAQPGTPDTDADPRNPNAK